MEVKLEIGVVETRSEGAGGTKSWSRGASDS